MSPKTKQKAVTRASSDERRDQVIQAAVHEFAEHGFRATSTSAIAKRAGISQPYIYALFPNKHELFLATHAYVVGHIRDAFTEAARGLDDPEDRLHAMGNAYMTLLEERDEILVQMQSHAAAGDPALRDAVRREFVGLIERRGARRRRPAHEGARLRGLRDAPERRRGAGSSRRVPADPG